MNSLIQSLVSCTPVVDYFLNNEEMYRKQNNQVACQFINLIKAVKAENKRVNPAGVVAAVIRVTKQKYPNKRYGRGQEDSGECLHLFLDAIDDEELYQYFMHRYLVKTWCLDCVAVLSEKKDESCVINVYKLSGFMASSDSETLDKLNLHIKQNMSVLEDYKCNKCEGKRCCRIYQLVKSPTVLTIMFNKFIKKSVIPFSQTLEFPSATGGELNYKLVSQIEHIGNARGGHYISISLRNFDRRIVSFLGNDMAVKPMQMRPTGNSYILFYCKS